MGQIVQINVSGGGVPKLPASGAEVAPGKGIISDDQADKVHHGGPLQDLSLFRLETILKLQQEGHPIWPGAAGENLTVFGIGHEDFRPGQLLALGAEVVAELTQYAVPCSKLMSYFKDGRFARISAKRSPESSRLYARVVRGGTLRPGDRVTPISELP